MPAAREVARKFVIASDIFKHGGKTQRFGDEIMKESKVAKKKKPTRKISLRSVRLQEVKFMSSGKTNNYPSIPIDPVN